MSVTMMLPAAVIIAAQMIGLHSLPFFINHILLLFIEIPENTPFLNTIVSIYLNVLHNYDKSKWIVKKLRDS